MVKNNKDNKYKIKKNNFQLYWEANKKKPRRSCSHAKIPSICLAKKTTHHASEDHPDRPRRMKHLRRAGTCCGCRCRQATIMQLATWRRSTAKRGRQLSPIKNWELHKCDPTINTRHLNSDNHMPYWPNKFWNSIGMRI